MTHSSPIAAAVFAALLLTAPRPRPWIQRGILSIKTTKPNQRRQAGYDDALRSDGYFTYAFQGIDPGNHDNRCLREAFDDQSPLFRSRVSTRKFIAMTAVSAPIHRSLTNPEMASAIVDLPD
jgi:hypothetical protein